jgi:hypothetical protein
VPGTRPGKEEKEAGCSDSSKAHNELDDYGNADDAHCTGADAETTVVCSPLRAKETRQPKLPRC